MANVRCPCCHGEGGLLGVLGCLRWFRCRACGIDFSQRVPGHARRRAAR